MFDEVEAHRVERTLQWAEAAASRQAFAEAHGCKDFAEVMARPIRLPERFPKLSSEGKATPEAFTGIAASPIDRTPLSAERLAELVEITKR